LDKLFGLSSVLYVTPTPALTYQGVQFPRQLEGHGGDALLRKEKTLSDLKKSKKTSIQKTSMQYHLKYF
jgi:hypothetical protein